MQPRTTFCALRARTLIKEAIEHDKYSKAIPVEGRIPPDRTNIIPDDFYQDGESTRKLPVCIVGAGAAGLYTAMILDSLNIEYDLLEASDRVGGRCFTYRFSDTDKFHDYYDVGAMRFPKIATMDRLFDLFERLRRKSDKVKLIKYIMNDDAQNNIKLFNGISKTTKELEEEAHRGADSFHDCVVHKGDVPDKYARAVYRKRNGDLCFGVDACLAAAFEPFKEALVDNWQKGWARLMRYDNLSTRAYLLDNMKYPLSVIRWMETRDTSTGAYDLAFTESVLDSLDFDYPHGVDSKGESKSTEWFCLDGGTERLTEAMHDGLKHKVKTGHRIESIAMTHPGIPTTKMKVSVRGHPEYDTKYYSHVVSTLPFSCLRCVDLGDAQLDYKQRQALRSLNYGAGIKVGIKFKYRWWQDKELLPGKDQIGGVSSTDRQSRVVVYPSYGLSDDPKDPGVLIAAYNWTQDAYRFGSLIAFKDWAKKDAHKDHRGSEEVLLDQVYKDLAAMHGKSPQWYRDQTLEHYAYDWYRNEYTMGAFALFGPGQFDNLYPDITKPAAAGNLHFAGEAASTHHAWIAGALDSAWRCVHEILKKDHSPKLLEFYKLWGRSAVLREQESEWQILRGICSKGLQDEAETGLATAAGAILAAPSA